MRNMFFIFSLLIAITCYAQPTHTDPKAPEPGTYKGYTVGSSVKVESGITTGISYGMQTQLSPSVFGDLVINANGTYQLTQSGETGTWNYDPQNESLGFTGKFASSQVRYLYLPQHLTIQVQYPEKDQFIQLSFSKKREKPFIKPENPNADYKDLLMVEPGNATALQIDLATGKEKNSLNGYYPVQSPGGYTTVLSASYGMPDIIVYDATGEEKHRVTANQLYDARQLEKVNAAAVSPDGKYLLVTGESAGSYGGFGGTAVSFSGPAYALMDVQGNAINVFESDSKNLWPGTWTSDGLMLVGGRDGGVHLLSLQGKIMKTIINTPVSLAKLSDDGENLAYVQDGLVYIKPLDSADSYKPGNGQLDELLRSFIITDLCWSPDGEALACSVQGTSIVGYKILLLKIDGSQTRFLSDDEGTEIQVRGGFIGWQQP